MDERFYNISFSKIYALGRHRERARKAMKYLRAFSARHMKTTEDKVVIGTDVNEYIWRNGIQKPPRRIRVKMMKDKDGTVMVSLEGAASVKSDAKEASGKGKKAEKPAAKPSGKNVVESPADNAAKGQPSRKKSEKPAQAAKK